MPSLPYMALGTIQTLAGAPLAMNVPMSLWPTQVRDEPSGRSYTHDGECPIAYLEVLDDANIRLVVASKLYHVVDVTAHVFLPHCALRLREMKGA